MGLFPCSASLVLIRAQAKGRQASRDGKAVASKVRHIASAATSWCTASWVAVGGHSVLPRASDQPRLGSRFLTQIAEHMTIANHFVLFFDRENVGVRSWGLTLQHEGWVYSYSAVFDVRQYLVPMKTLEETQRWIRVLHNCGDYSSDFSSMVTHAAA